MFRGACKFCTLHVSATWSMEQLEPNAVESFIMASDGTKCYNQRGKLRVKMKNENLEHDEVGGPPGQHEDRLVGEGGVHHLVKVR